MVGGNVIDKRCEVERDMSLGDGLWKMDSSDPELHNAVSLCLQLDPFVRMQGEFQSQVEIFLPSAMRK
ncbi:hypothetical protein Hanom_Chr13g01197191 [Helianthus anomalus]